MEESAHPLTNSTLKLSNLQTFQPSRLVAKQRHFVRIRATIGGDREAAGFDAAFRRVLHAHRESSSPPQGKSNPGTGKTVCRYRGERLPPQGRAHAAAGESAPIDKFRLN